MLTNIINNWYATFSKKSRNKIRNQILWPRVLCQSWIKILIISRDDHLVCDFLIIYIILKENSRYWSVLVGIFGIFSRCPNLTFWKVGIGRYFLKLIFLRPPKIPIIPTNTDFPTMLTIRGQSIQKTAFFTVLLCFLTVNRQRLSVALFDKNNLGLK